MGYKSQFIHQGWILAQLLLVPQTAKATQLSPTFRGPSWFHGDYPAVIITISGQLFLWVSPSWSWPFACNITPPSLWLDSRSSAQCLAVDLSICFHQLLDEGYMEIIKVAINLITWGRTFYVPSKLLLRFLAGLILVYFWNTILREFDCNYSLKDLW